tara:strand:+ start:40171 stop:40782 length:612 start_codon:yes stop_codon:yes gene_type:complete
MAKKAAAPKTETKVTQKTEKKTSEKVVAPPAPVEAAPVSNELVDDVQVQACTFDGLLKQLTSLASLANSLKSDVKALQKHTTKELKLAQKSTRGRKVKSATDKPPKAPSGFVKPTLITDELAAFLNKPSGTEMARTEVTREINSYIREHKLQDKSNGRRILADNKLAVLLKLTKEDELTYFNLQKYMSPHFAKGGVFTPATSV